MGYTVLIDDDFDFDFLWTKTQDIKGSNSTIYIGGIESCPIARIIVKGSGLIAVTQGIKVAMIEDFLPSNTLAIPKSLKALQIKSSTVKKYNLYIPDSLQELALTSSPTLNSLIMCFSIFSHYFRSAKILNESQGVGPNAIV